LNIVLNVYKAFTITFTIVIVMTVIIGLYQSAKHCRTKVLVKFTVTLLVLSKLSWEAEKRLCENGDLWFAHCFWHFGTAWVSYLWTLSLLLQRCESTGADSITIDGTKLTMERILDTYLCQEMWIIGKLKIN